MCKSDGHTTRCTKYIIGTPIILALGILFNGCVYDPVYYGPPAHTHYHPHHYDYYYYPSVGVYFHFTSGHYHYYHPHKRRWVKARTLPPDIHIDPHDRVRIKVESDKPYKKHPQHKRQYIPKPEYKMNHRHSHKEREANKNWYKKYEQGKQLEDKRVKQKMKRPY